MTEPIDRTLAKQSSPDSREWRLQQIRRQAEAAGGVDSRGILRAESAFSSAYAGDGYYGKPLLKAPAWTFEVPLYFFTGGAAGAAAIIAGVSKLTGADPRLARDARYLAAIGGAISPALLIADLGMPSRFLNMLRVFKIRSPMSVGSWTLVTFSSSAAAAAFLCAVERRKRSFGIFQIFESASHFLSAISGAALATYTGVLIGATAIPVWNENVGLLPIHFAASGMGAAASMLELRGHETPALNAIGITASIGETLVGASIELRKGPALKPLKSGRSGWLTRLGSLLSGPLPLVLRVLALGSNRRRSARLRRVAAVSTVAGSILTRFAWTQAGRVSANDPTVPLKLAGKPRIQRADE